MNPDHKERFLYEDYLEESFSVIKHLNNSNITPLLFGSIGLYMTIGPKSDVGDIDFLVPAEFIKKRFDRLQQIMKAKDYLLVDEHEHEFRKGDFRIQFSHIEDLEPFAGINIAEIKEIQRNDARFFLLTPEQFLKVYESSLKDSYRQTKKALLDGKKVKFIKEYLEKKNA